MQQLDVFTNTDGDSHGAMWHGTTQFQYISLCIMCNLAQRRAADPHTHARERLFGTSSGSGYLKLGVGEERASTRSRTFNRGSEAHLHAPTMPVCCRLSFHACATHLRSHTCAVPMDAVDTQHCAIRLYGLSLTGSTRAHVREETVDAAIFRVCLCAHCCTIQGGTATCRCGS